MRREGGTEKGKKGRNGRRERERGEGITLFCVAPFLLNLVFVESSKWFSSIGDACS
jgi:hypothetical protein